MRSICIIMMLAFALLLAQGIQPFNPFAGIYAPSEARQLKNGAWTMYNINNRTEGKTGRMKLSMLGDDERNGYKYHWFELEIWDDEGNHDIIKFLTKGDLTDESDGYLSVVMKHNDEPAYEFEFAMPEDTLKDMLTPPPNASEEDINKYKAKKSQQWDSNRYKITTTTEKITVPAGTFDCTRITQIDKETNERSDIWVSKDTPLFGFVKVKSNDTDMELVDYGNDGAKSAITETPQKINFNQMFNQQMKKSAKESAKEETEDAIDEAIKDGLKSIFGK